MKTKTCTRCGATKPLDDFYRNRLNADGYMSFCKACKKAYERNRRSPVERSDDLAYKTYDSGQVVIDYDHPRTRTFIREALRRLADDGHMPHRAVWRQERPACLSGNLYHVQEYLGFATIRDLAAWAGLEPAPYTTHNWARITRVVGAWIDSERDATEQALAEAEHEYGYGLHTTHDTPRTVRAYKPRSGRYVEVEAYLVR